MKVLMTDQLLKTETHYYKPYVRYIVSDYELDEIIVKAPKTETHWSSFASYERRYGGQDLNGKKLCIYRHNAWGDQLIASALPRYLKMLYPHSLIHLYCHPDVMPLWIGNSFLEGSAIPIPIPFDVAKNYDYHLFFEGMLEGNSEPDQDCCYDDMFAFAGHKDVPDAYKRPCVFPHPEDYQALGRLGLQGLTSKPFILYHAAPANMNRCYPVEKGMKACRALAHAFGVPVLVVGHDRKNEYGEVFNDSPELGVFNFINKTKNFRELIPLVERASLVVCPDSAILHLTACFPHVPSISLWGPFHPSNRSKYYPNDHPLGPHHVCPHAPCFDHNFFLPREQCKDAKHAPPEDKIKWCQVLNSITPEDIVELAGTLL